MAQLLAQRRQRRTEHDRAATMRAAKLISDSHGSSEQLRREVTRALESTAKEITAALSTVNGDGQTGSDQLSAWALDTCADMISRAAESLNLADVLATVLTGAEALEHPRAAS
ncbi:hypothetical protein ACL02T_29935 [Pseudonocardia sp. RS010]|uniref:hypothetical protein n=1 Tax=Pseudonocardia sp. RS010 TaxID=3385979 RepID=UPI0039A31A03